MLLNEIEKDYIPAFLLETFQKKYPKIVKDMKDTSHHYDDDNLNPYHLEGDVWSHTIAVFSHAVRLFKKDQITVNTLIAALLHDIGKPSAKNVKHEKKRVRFFGHEGRSFYMAVNILRDGFGIQGQQLKDILSIIALHSDLFHFNGSAKHIAKLKDKFKGKGQLLRDVYWHNICDHYGRILDPGENGYESVKKHKEIIFEIAASVDEYQEDEVISKDKCITILVGPPCSGKSTWTNANTSVNDHITSLDNTMMAMVEPGTTYSTASKTKDRDEVGKIMMDKHRNALKNGKNIIVDMTNMSAKSRRRKMGNVSKHYRKKCVLFVVDIEDLFKRTRIRAKEQNKFIADDLIKMMTGWFTLPMLDDFDEVEWVI